MSEPLYHEEFGTLDLNSLPVVSETNVQEGSLLLMFYWGREHYRNWIRVDGGRFKALTWVVQEVKGDPVEGRVVHIQLIKAINAPSLGEPDQWVTIKVLSILGYRVLS